MKDFFPPALRTLIIILAVLGLLALALAGYFGVVSDVLTEGLTQVQGWISNTFVAIQTTLNAPTDLVALRQENENLRAQLAILQEQMVELNQKVADAERLSALVQFSRTNPNNTYQAASVIGRDPSPFLHYIIIDRGSNDGIRRGMPVITEQGLVGRVDAVIFNAARVQLISDPASFVNVRLQNARAEAMLAGSVSGDLVLDMVSQEITLEQGDLVLTSGLGGGFPAELIVGQVLNIRRQESAIFQQATIQPVVDFSQLQIVLVITNFRPVDITPLIPSIAP